MSPFLEILKTQVIDTVQTIETFVVAKDPSILLEDEGKYQELVEQVSKELEISKEKWVSDNNQPYNNQPFNTRYDSTRENLYSVKCGSFL
jgi:hypothetical protein